eukprot:TRINITY_DN6046_c0_g1_i14.p1 TRINITY_DN6046_c0_g1~~TRINITY_DN6046_c0_g1_i14.p1  ORF type:complete len:402 (-),score=82.97 TRINITY_DN6046_c0_g1_i14:114-1319(-)
MTACKSCRSYKKRWNSMELCEALEPGDSFDWSYVLTQLVLFVMIGFLCTHAFFGLFHDNIYELYATMLAQVFLTLCVVGIVLSASWDTYHLLVLVYGVVYFLLYAIHLYPLYVEYSWTFFQKAGADPEFRTKYRRFLRFQVLLRIQLMSVCVNALLMGSLNMKSILWSVTFDLAMVLVSVVLTLLGAKGFQEEKKPVVYSFWTLQLLIPSYLGFIVYYIIKNSTLINKMMNEGGLWGKGRLSVVQVKGLLLLFIVSCGMLGLVWFMVEITSFILFRHFDEGLKNLEGLRKKSKRYVPPGDGQSLGIGSGGSGGSGSGDGVGGGAGTGGDKRRRENNNISGGERDEDEDEDEDGHQETQDVFQEIIHNTLVHKKENKPDDRPFQEGNVDSFYENYKKEHHFK